LYEPYKQAVCSLEKCIFNQDSSLKILPYIDTWLDDLLGEICNTVNLRKYCTPQLYALEKYDAENNSNLLKTLTCYYEHNQSVKETAEYMFLHRNTVKYRLNKCEEILETDLNNMSRNIGIYFSLKILSFLQQHPNM
jgi:Regulator of polyketide synthase expression